HVQHFTGQINSVTHNDFPALAQLTLTVNKHLAVSDEQLGSGGAAKLLIADGQVLVNGQRELRKSRKIVVGDTIDLAGEVLHMTE
ncbi:MAG: RNA-binding S4 domain-containing protein, partial [Burkholderiaceae bacterium]